MDVDDDSKQQNADDVQKTEKEVKSNIKDSALEQKEAFDEEEKEQDDLNRQEQNEVVQET